MLIKKGDTGDNVRTIQKRLCELGYVINIDGEFGPITELAVRDFQSHVGLKVDGIVGPKTLSALGIKLPDVNVDNRRKRIDPIDRVKELWPAFHLVSKQVEPCDPHLLAAIAWKESLVGTSNLLDSDYRGDNGHGHGMMQIDDRTWGKLFDPKFPKWWYCDVWSIATGAMILEQSYKFFKRNVSAENITDEGRKWLATAAYNCGPGNVRIPSISFESDPVRFLEICGYYTTGRTYPLDVYKHYLRLKDVIV